jgi:hypothetical protein
MPSKRSTNTTAPAPIKTTAADRGISPSIARDAAWLVKILGALLDARDGNGEDGQADDGDEVDETDEGREEDPGVSEGDQNDDAYPARTKRARSPFKSKESISTSDEDDEDSKHIRPPVKRFKVQAPKSTGATAKRAKATGPPRYVRVAFLFVQSLHGRGSVMPNAMHTAWSPL